jgi:hypothetical protein
LPRVEHVNLDTHVVLILLDIATMARNMKVLAAGYKLEYIWEADFVKMIKAVKIIQKKWRMYKNGELLNNKSRNKKKDSTSG